MFEPKLKLTESYQKKIKQKENEYDMLSKMGDLNIDFSFLKQDFSSIKNNENKNIEDLEKEAKFFTIKKINLINILSPIIKRAIKYSTDPKKQAKYVTTFYTDLLNTSKEFLVNVLNLDPDDKKNTWVINSVISSFSKLIPDEMYIEDLKESNLFSEELFKVISYLENQEKLDNGDFYDLSLTINLKMGLIESFTRIIVAQNNYSFYRNKDEDLKNILKSIIEDVKKSMPLVMLDLTTEKEKIVLFKKLFESACCFYVQAWESIAYKTKIFFEKNKLEDEQIKKKYPNGLPLKNVEQEYKTCYNSLINLLKLVK